MDELRHACGCHAEGRGTPAAVFVRCERHAAEDAEAWAEYQADHPDGRCTNACGCLVIPAGTPVEDMTRMLMKGVG